MSLPVTFGQILFTCQVLVNFRSLTVNFPSISRHLQSVFHHFRQFPSLLSTRYFGPPKSGPNADWKKSVFGPFWDRLEQITGKPDFSRKRDLVQFEAYIELYFHTENRMKSTSQFLAKVGKVKFWYILGSFGPKKGNQIFFPGKMIWVSFKPLFAPTFMCKIRKNLSCNFQIN